MRTGVREFLSEPFEQSMVAETLRNVQLLISKRPPVFDEAHQILSFIPSKAGVGCTTLAMNIAAALARPNEKRVLLTDLDLNSGMLRFLLQLFPEYSIIDAVENVENLDEVIWPQVTTSRFNMDLLHSGRVNPNLRIEPEQVSKLLTFVRRNYLNDYMLPMVALIRGRKLVRRLHEVFGDRQIEPQLIGAGGHRGRDHAPFAGEGDTGGEQAGTEQQEQAPPVEVADAMRPVEELVEVGVERHRGHAHRLR